MSTNVLAISRPRWHTALLWTLQSFAAAMFLFAGGLKLSGAPAMVQLFHAIGVGQWLRYLTGAIEVTGAVLLLTPFAFAGAAALAVTMAGAVLTHLFIVGGDPLMAVVLLFATGAVAWLRRSDR